MLELLRTFNLSIGPETTEHILLRKNPLIVYIEKIDGILNDISMNDAEKLDRIEQQNNRKDKNLAMYVCQIARLYHWIVSMRDFLQERSPDLLEEFCSQRKALMFECRNAAQSPGNGAISELSTGK